MIFVISQQDRRAELHLTEVLDMLLPASHCQILMSSEIDNDMKRRYSNSSTLNSSLTKCITMQKIQRWPHFFKLKKINKTAQRFCAGFNIKSELFHVLFLFPCFPFFPSPTSQEIKQQIAAMFFYIFLGYIMGIFWRKSVGCSTFASI